MSIHASQLSRRQLARHARGHERRQKLRRRRRHRPSRPADRPAAVHRARSSGQRSARHAETAAAIGYREVETAGFYGKSGKELRKILADHGMTAPSAHSSMGEIQKGMQKLVDGAAEVGAKYFVCAFPPLPPGNTATHGEPSPRTSRWTIGNGTPSSSTSSASWRRRPGCRRAITITTWNSAPYNGVVAFDQLLKLTDPKLVTIELDLGWVVTAGARSQSATSNSMRERISLLHVKDVRKDAVTTVDEMKARPSKSAAAKSTGRAIFAACDPKHLKHYFVEQENFTGSTLDAVRASFEYLSTLKA